MFKRVFAVLVLTVLFAETCLAAPMSAEELIDANAAFTFDVSIKGKLKDFVMSQMKTIGMDETKILETDSDETARGKTALAQLLSGERAFVSLSMPNNTLGIMKVTDDQWPTYTKEATTESYENETIYNSDRTYFTRLGGFLVISDKIDEVKHAIDRSNANGAGSLAKDANHMKLAEALTADRTFGFSVNLGALKSELDKIPSEEVPGLGVDSQEFVKNIIELVTHEGLSVSETATGYAFTAKVLGNDTKLVEKGLSFNPTGTFTPRLYTMMPSAAPLFYSESYNLKASNEMQNKMLKSLFGVDGASLMKEAFESATQETGVDFQKIISLFNQEYAFSIQHDGISAFPYVTFAANISDQRITADPLIQDMIAKLSAGLKKELGEDGTVAVSSDKKSMTITATPTDGDDKLFYDKMVFTVGITSDNLFVISNYPTVLDPSTRKGFASNTDFTAYPQSHTPVMSIAYMNARNMWKLADNVVNVLNNASPSNRPDVGTLKKYYQFEAALYSFKDMIVTTNATRSDVTVRGVITTDQAKHQTFAEFASGLKNKDTDNDSVSDFDERFVYNTDVSSKDCDHDGRSDTAQIAAGFDPCSTTPAFKDFEKAPASVPYYYDEAVYLKRAGVVRGYPDGTFGAGRTMTRAEFITMVVKAFGTNRTVWFGNDPSMYDDVHVNDWFHSSVMAAYEAGYISGGKHFRPGDAITRSEALQILNKASKSLKKDLYMTSCNGPFADVHTSDWFCAAVANGKAHGITSGRTPTEFAPQATLTRAEGAVMILKAMNLDLRDAANETDDGGSTLQDVFGSAF